MNDAVSDSSRLYAHVILVAMWRRISVSTSCFTRHAPGIHPGDVRALITAMRTWSPRARVTRLRFGQLRAHSVELFLHVIMLARFLFAHSHHAFELLSAQLRFLLTVT